MNRHTPTPWKAVEYSDDFAIEGNLNTDPYAIAHGRSSHDI